MTRTVVIARAATPFAKDGSLDESLLRSYFQRFSERGIGLSLASGGSGEGHALTKDEIRRIYQIGVEVGHESGVIVHSNQPQEHTALASIESARVAIAAGVDAVSIYGPAGTHSYHPTDEEYRRYFDRVLTEITFPVALNPNPIVGHSPPAELIADIANKYHQVVAIYLSGITDDVYPMRLRDRLQGPDVGVWAVGTGSYHALGLGADGIIMGGNFIPSTYRRYADLYDAKKFDDLDVVYKQIRTLSAFCDRWKYASPRFHKMVMKVFELPGADGGVREPHIDFDDSEVEVFTKGVLELDVPEVQEMARAAGLSAGR